MTKRPSQFTCPAIGLDLQLFSKRDWQEQRNSCSSLTLMLASIIYWQAKEIHRVLNECSPEENDVDISLVEHVSPITWDNVILYGEYVLNRGLVRV